MEFLRARREPELCRIGEFPVRARYDWARGGSLEFSLSPPRRRADGPATDFRIPPELPIWKPGELPPEDARPSASGEAVAVTNHDEIPLFVEVRGGDADWLAPGATRRFRKVGERFEYRARDFRGRLLLAGTPAAGSLAEGLTLAGPDAPSDASLRSP